MKKTIFFLTAICCFSAFTGYSQSLSEQIQKFSDKTNAKVSFNNNSKSVTFIKFPSNSSYKIAGEKVTTKALNFIEKSKLFSDLQSEDFRVGKVKTDAYGLNHVELIQTHNNVSVFDGRLKFHFNKNGNITSVNGNIISKPKLNTVPKISISEANALALEVISNQNLNKSGVPLFVEENQLVIYPKGIVEGLETTNYLTYHIEVRNNTDVREYIFIDAITGKSIEQFTGMAHALDRIVYEENTSNIAWQEGDAIPGSLTIWQQNEVVASEHTYNFFKNAFGYISYDGADAQMITINNNPNINCPNANWNGFSANYCDGTASDDVIAHEWGHAYTEFTNNLIYQWQSGAINEAYSDIWGETIDLLNNYEDAGEDLSLRTGCNSSDRWRMGEDASAFGNPIRDMWIPPCNGDPGKVSDSQYHCETTDSGGVHINSGIPNRAYALLVDGGTFNGYTINSIGFTKAAHIFWRAQSEYLTQSSDFIDLADALEASAQDLLGVNLEGLSTTTTPAGPSGEIISATDVQTVMNAILAVEMRMNPDACNFQPILANSTPPCEASSSNPIFREDWETGTDGWSFEQLPSNPSTWENRDWTLNANLPAERTGNAIFGTNPINGNCTSDLENGIIRLESPLITIPNYATGNTELFFNHYVATEANWDGGNIKYQLDGGAWTLLPASAFTENPYNGTINPVTSGNDNPLQSEDAFTGSDEGSVESSWGTSIVDLSQIGVVANSTLKLRFEVGSDGCNGRDGWYLDEIAVYNCNFALSVKDFNDLAEILTIYPNPSNGIFNLKKNSKVDLTFANIYDLNGRLINKINLESMNTETQVNISNSATGLYFVEVNSKSGKHTFKIFKN
ncbi:bacillolysin [Winogradskyella sp. PC-19]|uniref:M4 family metallopeptidase n=1 Tax=unclassified Winogradskyella TaxID=2615021 RepID=UPI000B3CC360|nr:MULTISPECIES: M4 family metallopeptidase [unclassified Winogradskyella]ARV08337.1 bacillolysin [Winogradskyella sp. PC-19]RZN79663.1 MAG: T9SS type A sorting domain-containing protein [Winogradskyella sp.]